MAFWLVPAEPWKSALAARIATLAAAHAASAFEPHVTIEVTQVPADAQLEALIVRVCDCVEAMTLVAGKTAHSEDHFKTLFAEFDDPQPFALQQRLREELGHDEGYVLRPHLSLLYRGKLDAGVREALAGEQRFDGARIVFDSLVVVWPSYAGGGLSDIDAIDTTMRRRLKA